MNHLLIKHKRLISPQRHRVHRGKAYGFKIIYICFLLLITSGVVRAELFVYELKYQTAGNAISLIQPHLSKDASITAKEFQLLVNGTQEDNQKVIDILNVIDIKLNEYSVEVKILDHKMDAHQFNSTKTKVGDETVRKKFKQFHLDNDRNINNRNANNHFNIRMAENYQAFISTGESFPDNQVVSQYGHLLPSSGRTKISSGFYMLIQQNSTISARQIAVRVSVHQQQIDSSQAFNSSSASTKFAGELGKWILIASNADHKTANSNKRYSTNSKTNKQRWYYVRVTDANFETQILNKK